ncbi:MAG: hypothetical protein RR014_03880, partial [Bilophila sp.]
SRSVRLRRSARSDPGTDAGHAHQIPAGRQLHRALARLITAGHPDACNYGWSFFVLALEELEAERSQSIKDMAVACRVALGADKQAFTRFVTG